MLIRLFYHKLGRILLTCIAALSFIFLVAPLQAHASQYNQYITSYDINVTTTWDDDAVLEAVDVTMSYSTSFTLYYNTRYGSDFTFPDEIQIDYDGEYCGTAVKSESSSEQTRTSQQYSVTLNIPFHFSSYNAASKSETIQLNQQEFTFSFDDIILDQENHYYSGYFVYTDALINLAALDTIENSTFSSKSAANGAKYKCSVINKVRKKDVQSSRNISGETVVTTYILNLTVKNSAIPKGALDLTAQKTVNNKIPDQRYMFYLLGADGTILQTKRNDLSDGSITFDSIEYDADDIGTEHTYYVKELAGTDEWTIYDDSVYTVKVTPSLQSDDASVIVVEPIITKDGEEVSAITFNNTVDEEQSMEATDSNATESDATESDATENNEPATPSDTDDPGDSDGSVISDLKRAVGSLMLKGLAMVNGHAPGSNYIFSFDLLSFLGVDGNHVQTKQNDLDETIPFAPISYSVSNIERAYTYQMRDKAPDQSYTSPDALGLLSADGNLFQTKQNDAEGNILFDTIWYDSGDIGKTYTYQVKEQAGSDPTITYDNSVYTVTVTPYLDPDDDSVIIADPIITKDGNEVSEILFNNTVNIARGNSGSSGGGSGSSSGGSNGHSSQSSDSGNPSQSVDSAGLPQANNSAEMPQSAGSGKLPKTGESASPVLWFAAMAAAAAGLYLGLRKKKQE